MAYWKFCTMYMLKSTQSPKPTQHASGRMTVRLEKTGDAYIICVPSLEIASLAE